MKRIFALVVLGLLVSCAAVAQKTNIDWDRQANFSDYHTYMWEKSPHPAKGFWDQRIVDAVDKQLQAKGSHQGGFQSRSVGGVQQQHPRPEGSGGNRLQLRAVLGLGTVGSTPTTYNTWVTKLGTLVVEISDVKQKELLWRGSVTDTISDNSNKNIKNLDNAVAKLFKGYPPKGSEGRDSG